MNILTNSRRFTLYSIVFISIFKNPDYLKITGELRGRTHRAHFIENNEKKFWRYGHTVDLEMECATGIGNIMLII